MALLELISQMPVFENLTEAEKKLIVQSTYSFLEFKKGDAIIKEGDCHATFYLLIKGTALVTKMTGNTQIRLAKLKSGEVFGEMSFFSRKPRSSNVIAGEKVLVMKMDEDFFRKVTPDIRDKIKNYFIVLLIQRLDDMNLSIMRISKLMRG